MRGKPNIECFILYPEGGVSSVQENQMTTITDDNVHCIAVDKDFDCAQDIVKACFNDNDFRLSCSLGAVNSINWARILGICYCINYYYYFIIYYCFYFSTFHYDIAQIVYYFYAYFRVIESEGEEVDVTFSVPTGNFGDILAGYYAKKIGLKINNFIVATNENDILHRFFTTGEYHRLPVTPTLAPSMDICISSNFERLLYHLCEEDSKILNEWMEGVSKYGKLTLKGEMLQKAQNEMSSYRSDTKEVLEEIKSTFQNEKYLLCPHSAVAVVAAKQKKFSGKTISLLTASPAKFPLAIKKAIGVDFIDSFESKALRSLSNLPKKKLNLPAKVEVIQNEVKKVLSKLKKNSNDKGNDKTSLLLYGGLAVTGMILLTMVSLLAWKRRRGDS